MTISIIIPVYNVEPYIRNCLMSVMHQTYKGTIECLIVDDCGADNSIPIAEQMIAAYEGPIKFQILHHHHNRGLSAARNTGMDAAIGDYIYFLDSDDELTDDCIEKLVKPLKKEWYDVVLGDIKIVEVLPTNQTRVIKNKGGIAIVEDLLLKPPYIMETFKKNWREFAWNKLYRSKFLQDNHIIFKEGLLYEDIPWSFQIACKASSFYLVSHVTYIYKRREGSIMDMSKRQDFVKNFTIIIKELDSYLNNNHINSGNTFPFFDYVFSYILNVSSHSLSDYVSVYRAMSPYVNISFKSITKVSNFNLKYFLSKLHYVMPKCIAPYWQYYYFVILRGFYRKVMRKDKQ